MNTPKLKFIKPLAENGERSIHGKRVIRFGVGLRYDGVTLPGYYLISRDLEAWFVPSGKCDWQAEFVCKVERDIEKAFDRAKDERSRGRWLWTPAAVQRSLTKLYTAVRKDWESRCNKENAQ